MGTLKHALLETDNSAVAADSNLSLLETLGAVGLDATDEEEEALLGEGGGPRPLHGLRLVGVQDAVGVGGHVVTHLHHVVPGSLPVEVDDLSGGDTGHSLLTSYDPFNIEA